VGKTQTKVLGSVLRYFVANLRPQPSCSDFVTFYKSSKQSIRKRQQTFVEGEKGCTRMAPEREPHEPASVIAHNLINKLTAIVGHSDLLIESTERGAEYARRQH
jgi:hypothetical protein